MWVILLSTSPIWATLQPIGEGAANRRRRNIEPVSHVWFYNFICLKTALDIQNVLKLITVGHKWSDETELTVDLDKTSILRVTDVRDIILTLHCSLTCRAAYCTLRQASLSSTATRSSDIFFSCLAKLSLSSWSCTIAWANLSCLERGTAPLNVRRNSCIVRLQSINYW